MGLLKVPTPPVNMQEWKSDTHLRKVRPLAVRWVEYGAESPSFVIWFYVIKLAGYLVGGLAIIAATPGIGGLSEISTWWHEPIVYQKIIIFTCLVELLGLGSSTGPLCFKFKIPFVAFLHWARVGTLRQPPWPQLPLTRGDSRTFVDVALYLAIIGYMVAMLASAGSRTPPPGAQAGLLGAELVVPFVALMVAAGLRDKVMFVAARAEVYVVPAAIFLFPYEQMMIGLQIALVFIWLGAGISKITHHFPAVVSVMTSNAPLRPKAFKRALYRDFPHDLRPSRAAFLLAHSGTVVEIAAPFVLLFTGQGWLAFAAVSLMVVFHVNIISHMPLAVPNEWNVFMIAGVIFLFWTHADVAVTDLRDPVLITFLLLTLVAPVVLGSIRPDIVSFALAMRYYAGNWPASLWCFKGDAIDRVSPNIRKAAPMVNEQLEWMYDEDFAQLMNFRFRAWRSLHPQGRALNGLLARGLADVDNYYVVDGELIASSINGWNMGDGHMHNEQLLAAVQRRCGFAPGELVVVMIESQPIHRATHDYRIIDAALGELESGSVRVADLIDRQPWDESPLPVRVRRRRAVGTGDGVAPDGVAPAT
jgi:hypothetical protein